MRITSLSFILTAFTVLSISSSFAYSTINGCFGPVGQHGISTDTYVRYENPNYYAKPSVNRTQNTILGALLGGVGGYALGHNSENRELIAGGSALLGGIIGYKMSKDDSSYTVSYRGERSYYVDERDLGKYENRISASHSAYKRSKRAVTR